MSLIVTIACKHRNQIFAHSDNYPDFMINACVHCSKKDFCFCGYCQAVLFDPPDEDWIPSLAIP
jgi:hypothetical protein